MNFFARFFLWIGLLLSSFNTHADNPPIVDIASPASGALYVPPATISFAVTATDDGSINRVELYRNDETLPFGVTFAAPYSFDLTGVAAGSYTFRARAYDNLDVYSDSASISVIVNTLPVVKITTPVNNAVILAPASFEFLVNATDADGNLSKVQFYQNGILLGEDNTYPYSWPLSNLPWGTYAYKAMGYDALGAVVTSLTKNVIVNEAPTVGLAATGAFGGFNAPADIVLTASPKDVDGTISRVEFYSGSQLIGTVTTSPYIHTVVGATAGSYSYTARVYDNRSATADSNEVSITLTPAATPTTFSYDELGRLVGVQH